MRRIHLFLAIVPICLQLACDEGNQPSGKQVSVLIEIESSFQNDLVTLLLDDKTLLESRITTNDVLSLAWSSGFVKLSNDSHSLQFEVVAYKSIGGYNIDLSNDTSTVTIRFDRSTKQIHFQQFKGRLWRD